MWIFPYFRGNGPLEGGITLYNSLYFPRGTWGNSLKFQALFGTKWGATGGIFMAPPFFTPKSSFGNLHGKTLGGIYTPFPFGFPPNPRGVFPLNPPGGRKYLGEKPPRGEKPLF